MIDIHSHILPSLDDGAADLQEAIGMAQAAVAEGIRTIIATPHHANGRYMSEASGVLQQVDAFNAILAESRIPLRVLPGQEIRVYGDLLDDFQQGKLLGLGNSSYILLEFPSSGVPEQIEELLHELRVLGLIPIIAHPERNAELARNPERLRSLIELGALSQVTSHSINGLFGKAVQQQALMMCRTNLAHFIASDAHNLSHRAFGLKQAYRRIEELLGAEYVSYFLANAEAVGNSNYIEIWQPRLEKKKWFQFWK